MNATDLEMILKIWHGKFDHRNEADKAQAVKTYDRIIALKKQYEEWKEKSNG